MDEETLCGMALKAHMAGAQKPSPKPVVTRRLTRNAIRCNKCGDMIESKHRHDFRACSCKAVFVDGGRDYMRIGGEANDWTGLSEWAEA